MRRPSSISLIPGLCSTSSTSPLDSDVFDQVARARAPRELSLLAAPPLAFQSPKRCSNSTNAALDEAKSSSIHLTALRVPVCVCVCRHFSRRARIDALIRFEATRDFYSVRYISPFRGFVMRGWRNYWRREKFGQFWGSP